MSLSEALAKISEQLSIDVDNFCEKHFEQDFREHLGASVIGDECHRKLWYQFRWVIKSDFDARMLRLFNRGHLEEERFIDYLRGIGCVVRPFDYSIRLMRNPQTGTFVKGNILDVQPLFEQGYVDVTEQHEYFKEANEKGVKYPVQYACSAVEGHFGGSCDGVGRLPESYGLNEDVLFEFKTANEKSFNQLVKDGMRKHQPKHYAQACTYGYLMKLRFVVYCAVCKNDDRLYFEILQINHKTGEIKQMEAERIIKSQTPPPRLFENPTYFVCKMCPAFGVCHGDTPPLRNCRSCKFAEPAKEGKWVCNKHNCIIPSDQMRQEYQCWESIC